jgi:hypothetical protein
MLKYNEHFTWTWLIYRIVTHWVVVVAEDTVVVRPFGDHFHWQNHCDSGRAVCQKKKNTNFLVKQEEKNQTNSQVAFYIVNYKFSLI